MSARCSRPVAPVGCCLCSLLFVILVNLIARVVATGDAERHIHRTVGTGGSFGSSSLQQEIGLGAAESIVALKVRWPASGKTQVFTDVPLDGVFAIREDSNTLEPISTRPIPLEGGTAQRPSVGAGE